MEDVQVEWESAEGGDAGAVGSQVTGSPEGTLMGLGFVLRGSSVCHGCCHHLRSHCLGSDPCAATYMLCNPGEITGPL